MKLLLIGPMPKGVQYFGGTHISFKVFVEELKNKEIDYVLIDTDSGNRLSRIILYPFCIIKVFLYIHQVDIVSLHASTNATLIMGPIIFLIGKLFGKIVSLRVFGGSFMVAYNRMPVFIQWLIDNTVLSSDLLLLQTKQMVSVFTTKPKSNIIWFPTNRPMTQSRTEIIKKDSVVRFVFISNVKPSKGIYHIIEAADILGKDYSVQVHVYGRMSDGVEIKDFDHAKARYKGVLPYQNVISKLQEYDVLLLPTYYSGEGYPGIIIEAYMAGIPVITTKWKYIPEIVDESSGILIEPRNTEELLKAMKHIIESPELLAELKKGAKSKSKEFSSEEMAKLFINECRKLF